MERKNRKKGKKNKQMEIETEINIERENIKKNKLFEEMLQYGK